MMMMICTGGAAVHEQQWGEAHQSAQPGHTCQNCHTGKILALLLLLILILLLLVVLLLLLLLLLVQRVLRSSATCISTG